MKASKIILPLITAAALGLTSYAGAASAQESTTVSMRTKDRVKTTGPNRALMRSGIWTLGVGYLPAAVVGLESSLPADKNLLIPVAGPWLDYAKRDCPGCTHETMNKAMLVGDGILQGIGALQILGSFLFWETRTTATAARSRATQVASAPRLQVVPARVGRGYGVSARGSF